MLGVEKSAARKKSYGDEDGEDKVSAQFMSHATTRRHPVCFL
jgi:hypothetical protein